MTCEGRFPSACFSTARPRVRRTASTSQWPSQVLTEIIPPYLPGKLTLAWSELTVDVEGVRTLGAYRFAERAPRVSIVGPRDLSMRPIGHVTASYRVDIGDLRAPLTAQWTGVADGSGGLVAKAMFHSSGSFPIRATVRDVDGLSGTGGTTVSVSPLEGGQQPF
jgi:hypothetical protein